MEMNTLQEGINGSKYGGNYNPLRSGTFEGRAIVIPPALSEDTYSCFHAPGPWLPRPGK